MTKIIAIIDGTLSKLDHGKETHAGKLFKLALRLPPQKRRVFYDSGVQGRGWNKWFHVATGEGLNISIIKTYQKISQHYKKGDKIYLFGYSRGAYAVRVVAGMIDQIGLLQRDEASFRNSERILQHYEQLGQLEKPFDIGDLNLRTKIPIAFLGVWDTVKAIGFKIPFIGQVTPLRVNFKDLTVPSNVKIACQALAMDETRTMFKPELWNSKAAKTLMKQQLFRGDHAVVGGHIEHDQSARALGNFSFLWMMGEANAAGLALVGAWQDEFPTDPCAPLHDGRSWFDWAWTREKRTFEPANFFTPDPTVQMREKCPES